MLFLIILISLALILYSTAIWSEKIIGRLLIWMAIVFSAGFACDLTGTTLMFLRATHHHLTLHSVCGYLALIIMGCHLAWALLALIKHGWWEAAFHRYSTYAWVVWLLAFISGVPK